MSTLGTFLSPIPINEPILSYAPGTKERALLQEALRDMRSREVEVPMYIGNKEVREGKKIRMSPPHDHAHTLGYFYEGGKTEVAQGIEAALEAKKAWASLAWEQRATVFLKAAELIAGPYRYKLNAATMLGQSKNAYQAEIDSACEMIDFLRFNVHFMTEIYKGQPNSSPGIWNRTEYRPLEGFIYALTPFNFTAIAGNLPAAPALMGNTVVWKPSYTQVYSAQVLMEIFKEAGLPSGVINLVMADGPEAGEVVFAHPEFAGIHFTGSTAVFKSIWKTIANNLDKYLTFPRIVGETGGKDFVVAHASAAVKPLVTALLRGAYEYQGQKCSAASRAYIPDILWPQVQEHFLAELATMKMGPTEDFGNFINAVIDEKAFDKITSYIEKARSSKDATIVAGGTYDKSKGYFVSPTLILTTDPHFVTLEEEIFGPVLTVYVYPAQEFEKVLKLVDQTSGYSLTGAIFAQDRYALDFAMKQLENAAGNIYLNDKPTGAVVGQQPFGGARLSGTNDKAGSPLNLLRWVSCRTIKEAFVSPSDYRYPFLG